MYCPWWLEQWSYFEESCIHLLWCVKSNGSLTLWVIKVTHSLDVLLCIDQFFKIVFFLHWVDKAEKHFVFLSFVFLAAILSLFQINIPPKNPSGTVTIKEMWKGSFQESDICFLWLRILQLTPQNRNTTQREGRDFILIFCSLRSLLPVYLSADGKMRII